MFWSILNNLFISKRDRGRNENLVVSHAKNFGFKLYSKVRHLAVSDKVKDGYRIGKKEVKLIIHKVFLIREEIHKFKVSRFLEPVSQLDII